MTREEVETIRHCYDVGIEYPERIHIDLDVVIQCNEYLILLDRYERLITNE